MSRRASRSGVQVGGALPIVPQLQCMRVCGRGCTNSANNYSQEKLFVHALGNEFIVTPELEHHGLTTRTTSQRQQHRAAGPL